MSQAGFPNLSFLNPGQGPLSPPSANSSPWGQTGWSPRQGRQPGYSGQAPSFTPPNGGRPAPTMLDQAWMAFLNDYSRMQPAADQQYGRMDSAIQGLGQTSQQWAGNIQGTADQTHGDIDSLMREITGGGQDTAGRLHQFGDELHSFSQAGNPALDRDIDSAYAHQDRAEAGFEQGIRSYQDRGAMDASSVSAGLQARARSQMDQIKAGIHPDGTPMTRQEQEEQMMRVRQETDREVADQVTQIYDHVNDMKATLDAQLAQLRAQGAHLRLEGGGLREQERGLQLEGEKAAGQMHQAGAQVEQQTRELLSGLGQYSAQIRNAGVLSAAQLMVQGREAMAQFIQNNPHSIISLFSGLTAMLSLASAPGIGSIGAATVPGVDFLGGRR